MYEDEKEEVIHDTLENKESLTFKEKRQTDYLLVKHLRALVQEEIAKRFDEQPTSYNSFKKEEIEELIDNKLGDFLEDYKLEDKIKEECQSMLDDAYVEINTTAYISN